MRNAVGGLHALMLVNKRWHDLACDDGVWRALVLEAREHDGKLSFRGSWKATLRAVLVKKNQAEARRRQLLEQRLARKEGRPVPPSSVIDGEDVMAMATFDFSTSPPLLRLGCWGAESGQIERVDGRALSASSFASQFDAARLPTILVGVVSEWRAFSRWQLEEISKHYGAEVVACAQYSKRGRIRIALGDFVAYMKTQRDVSPLYVFDEDVIARVAQMREDYAIPEFLWQDLFVLLGKHLRPSYRWLLLGPERSGSGFHFDPHGTTAWNALLVGRKRWALYPPGRVPPGVKVEADDDGFVYSFEAPDPLSWLRDVLPRLAQHERPIEFTQQAGELVFVPSGWWHQVLNLEPTVSVTQNLCNEHNLDAVTESLLRDGHGDMLQRLTQRLQLVEPRLYHLTRQHTQRAIDRLGGQEALAYRSEARVLLRATKYSNYVVR